MQHTAPQISATIIAGYLGAGKTTLVNHLLRNNDGRRFAVLVNEFGELAIDADLIESDEGDLLSLSGGCICCSYGSDLMDALIKLSDRAADLDGLLIEASGVALPGGIGAGCMGMMSCSGSFVSTAPLPAVLSAMAAIIVDRSTQQLTRILYRSGALMPSVA